MKITKELAHILCDENLFVQSVHRTAVADRFEGEFAVSPDHAYLYENPEIANHISGTSYLDICRQFLKAISHLFYEAPISNRFVIRSVNMDFARWGKLKVPILARFELHPRATVMRGEKILTFTTQVSFFQEGRLLGTVNGEFSTFSQKVEDLLMSRQYRQAPLMIEDSEALKLAA